MPHPAAVELSIKPSVALAVVLGILHAMAAASVLIVALPGAAKALIALFLGASAYASIRRHAFLMGSSACVGVRVRTDGSCEARLASGMTETGTLSSNWFVSGILVVLNFRSESNGRMRAVILLPDSAERDALRLLRVFLSFRMALRSGGRQDRIGRFW